MKTDKRKLGDIGENVACEFLEKRGYKILDRNYLRKWGELDIVAEKGGVTHFVEVKSVTWETSLRPEENMHPGKLKRLARIMQTYVMDKNIRGDWQLDLVTVRIDEGKRVARAELLENIII